MEIMEGFLREAALTGDPAKVATVKPILKAKFANAPSCKPWIVDVDGKSYAQAEEYCTRAARFLGGDAAAFDGQFQTFQGHSYLWCNQWQTFDEAKAFAAKLGGHVVTITSEEENDFIIQQLEAGTFKRDCTLGLERTGEGRMAWKWVTGEPLEYHNWGPESGAGADGAVFVQEKGQWLWFHHSRGNVRPFIIEWDTPTPQPPLAAAQ